MVKELIRRLCSKWRQPFLQAACWGHTPQVSIGITRFTPKPRTPFERGQEWARQELAEGNTPDGIEAMLDGKPPHDFDQGALDVLRGQVFTRQTIPTC